MTAQRRIVSRFIIAELGIGRTFYTGSLKLHRFRESLQITDLSNAGLRGKTVPEMHIGVGYKGREEADAILAEVAEIAVHQDNYAQVKAAIADWLEQNPDEIQITETALRGVDVEPAGTRISLKTNTGLRIEAEPSDFRILHSQPMVHPKTGEPIGNQDTNYYSTRKQDATVFYRWLKLNLSRANRMTMDEFRNLWDSLHIGYDSH